MDGHLDIALMAHRHQLLQEIFQVLPQLLLCHRLVSLKPPWDIFGLPRLLVDAASVDKFLAMV